MCNNEKHNEDHASMVLLRRLYSLGEGEYQSVLETDCIWQLPYDAISEFLKPIILVFNETFGLEETIGFIKDYYDNQSKYSEEYQLTEIQKELIEMVVKEELTRGEFCSSCQALIKTGSKTSKSYIDINATKRTEFMVEKARTFIDKIALGDSSLPKEYKLKKERLPEIIEMMSEKGYRYIKQE